MNQILLGQIINFGSFYPIIKEQELSIKYFSKNAI
jgi:hypothetical protein